MSVLHAQIDLLPESNNTLPFKTIFPRSGVSMPAMHFNVMLLPQPDAPRIPVIPCFPSVSKETDSTLSFSFFRSPPVNSSFFLSTQIHSCHDEQGKSNNDQHVFSCGIHIPGRHLRINGEWQCPCFSCNISGDHRSRSEFAEPSCECEHAAGEDSRSCLWQNNFPENGAFTHAKRPARIDQICIDLLDRASRRAVHQWKRDHDSRQNGCLPAEHDFIMKYFFLKRYRPVFCSKQIKQKKSPLRSEAVRAAVSAIHPAMLLLLWNGRTQRPVLPKAPEKCDDDRYDRCF